MFLPVILCSAELNIIKKSPNDSLCFLIQNNFHYQITLKSLNFKAIEQATGRVHSQTNQLLMKFRFL